MQTAYLFTHFAYFLYFNNIFHAQQFVSHFFEGFDVVRNSGIPKDFRYLIVFLDFPVLLFIAKESYSKLNLRKIFIFLCITCLSVPLFNFNSIKSSFSSPITYEWERDVINRYGLLGNDILNLIFAEREELLIKEFDYGASIAYKNNSNAKPRNIICIQVESLDSNIINTKYKGKYIAPFLHQLSLRSIYYPAMLTYRFSGSTSDIEFSVFNSVIPPEYHPAYRFKKYSYPNSAIKPFKEAGFETIGFHDSAGYIYSRNKVFLNTGFSKFYDGKGMSLKKIGWYSEDGNMIGFIKSKLRKQKAPFLYYIVTVSSHEPFNYVGNYYVNERYNDIDKELIRNYFNSMSYVDNVLRDIVLFVKNNIPNTHIFIFGDHTPINMRNSSFFKKSLLENYLEYVPLFIITPDNKRYIEKSRIASAIDLSQTLLYASGIDFKIKSKGVNLLDFPIKKESVPLKYNRNGNRKILFQQFKNI